MPSSLLTWLGMSTCFLFPAYVFSVINSHLSEESLWGRNKHRLTDPICVFALIADEFKVPQSHIFGKTLWQILFKVTFWFLISSSVCSNVLSLRIAFYSSFSSKWWTWGITVSGSIWSDPSDTCLPKCHSYWCHSHGTESTWIHVHQVNVSFMSS